MNEESKPDERQQRWQSEASFFDEYYEPVRLLDPATLKRYSPPHRKRFNKEFRFHLLGDLKGKTVLDVGCGDGTNAVTLAALGARVTGIDISPKSIELARERAQVNGLSDRVEFICKPLELADLAPGSFDVAWGDAILHHLISDLDGILDRIAACVKPGGLMIFSEPVNFNRVLRRIRFMVPVHTDVTPDERPLEKGEVRIIAKHIAGLRLRRFALFGRLDRFILPNYNYERASAIRRAIVNTLALTDALLLALPGIRSMAGTAVFYGTPSGAKR